MISENNFQLFPFITGNWLIDFIFILYIVFIIAPISMFIHEFGHAIGAKFVKADQVKINIGFGKRKTMMKIFSIHIFIFLCYFLGGYVISERNPSYTDLEKIIISLFGPIFNILLAIILYFTLKSFSNPFISVIYIFNFWLGFINLIPFKIFGKSSDGHTILKGWISFSRRNK